MIFIKLIFRMMFGYGMSYAHFFPFNLIERRKTRVLNISRLQSRALQTMTMNEHSLLLSDPFVDDGGELILVEGNRIIFIACTLYDFFDISLGNPVSPESRHREILGPFIERV